jgi:hypothetical protein
MKRFLLITLSISTLSFVAACSTIGGAVVGGIAGGLWGDAQTGAAIGGTIGAIDDMFGY